MRDSVELARWIDKLGDRIDALREIRQQELVTTENLVALSPDWTARAVHTVLAAAVCRRDRVSKLLAEATVLGLVHRVWPEHHRAEARDAAAADDLRLVEIMLLEVGRVLEEEDQRRFEVPRYDSERPLTLGERRSLATKPSRGFIQLAVRDPHPMVVEKLLDNPKLTENDVIFLASRQFVPAAALAEVVLHNRWRMNRRVAVALVNNPILPESLGLTLLPGLAPARLKEVSRSQGLAPMLREAASEMFGFDKK